MNVGGYGDKWQGEKSMIGKHIGRLEPSNPFRAKWPMRNRPKSMKTIPPDMWACADIRMGKLETVYKRNAREGIGNLYGRGVPFGMPFLSVQVQRGGGSAILRLFCPNLSTTIEGALEGIFVGTFQCLLGGKIHTTQGEA